MTIQNVQWASGDAITRTKLANMVADEVNKTDDIHPQYKRLVDSIEYLLINSGGVSHNLTTWVGGMASTFEMLTSSAISNRISWIAFNEISITIVFSIKTKTTVIANNQVRLGVSKHVVAGVDLTYLHGTTYASSVAETWRQISLTLVYATDLSALNISSGDQITLGLQLDEDGVAGRYASSKALYIVRNFA